MPARVSLATLFPSNCQALGADMFGPIWTLAV
jgi:hypothetical protein